jgi:hypothetical protein
MALAEEALKAGKTPLEVMLTRMRALDARETTSHEERLARSRHGPRLMFTHD